MQEFQNIQELSDQELETVVGGHSHYAATNALAGTQVSASATGGQLNFDVAYAQTKSLTITARGESASVAVGFAMALAL